MDIQEIANSYAEGKANEAITKAIAQVYLDGYKDGYKSGKENAKIECNDAEFVDLGLPSGTLWASDYLKDIEEKSVIYHIWRRKNIPFQVLNNGRNWNNIVDGMHLFYPIKVKYSIV